MAGKLGLGEDHENKARLPATFRKIVTDIITEGTKL